ncbi:MAG: hypothetical protein KKA19_06940 [Candidatus Margulisbacteria bacterium]|nr:hypothetical protein [Candidatus Margulisiibacteriota bacterium]
MRFFKKIIANSETKSTDILDLEENNLVFFGDIQELREITDSPQIIYPELEESASLDEKLNYLLFLRSGLYEIIENLSELEKQVISMSFSLKPYEGMFFTRKQIREKLGIKNVGQYEARAKLKILKRLSNNSPLVINWLDELANPKYYGYYGR